MARKARIKLTVGSYYHVTNCVAGFKEDRPFGDIEKAYFYKLLNQMREFYTIDVLSSVCMSNHFHLVIFAPRENPSHEVVVKRYKKYRGQKFNLVDENCLKNEQFLAKLASRMRDISEFMKDFQQRFTRWYNRTRKDKYGSIHPRRGRLWQDRFFSGLIEKKSYLWICLLYIELNPVRAHIYKEASLYNYSSYGQYCGSGKHPYKQELIKHFKSDIESKSDEEYFRDLMEEMRKAFFSVQTFLFGGEDEESQVSKRLEEISRRASYWTKGLLVGSKSFVLEHAAKTYEKESLKRLERRLKREEKSNQSGLGIFSLQGL